MVYGIQSPFTGEILYPPTGLGVARSSRSRNLEYLARAGAASSSSRTSTTREKRATLIGIPAERGAGRQGIVLAEPRETAQAKAQKVLDKGVWPRFLS